MIADDLIEALCDILSIENHFTRDVDGLTPEVRKNLVEVRKELVNNVLGGVRDEKFNTWCIIKHALLAYKQLREVATHEEDEDKYKYYVQLSLFYKDTAVKLMDSLQRLETR